MMEDLIERLSVCALEIQFESKTLEEYRCSARVVFPRCFETAIAVLILFATTYLYASQDLALFCQLRQNLEIA